MILLHEKIYIRKHVHTNFLAYSSMIRVARQKLDFTIHN